MSEQKVVGIYSDRSIHFFFSESTTGHKCEIHSLKKDWMVEDWFFAAVFLTSCLRK